MSRYKLRANYDIENIDSQKMDGTVIVDVPMLSNGELNYGLSHIKKKLYEENIGRAWIAAPTLRHVRQF